MTPEQIRDELNNDWRHWEDCTANAADQSEADLWELVVSKYRLMHQRDAKWVGPLIDARDDPAATAEQQWTIDQAATYLSTTNKVIDCGSNSLAGQGLTGITDLSKSLLPEQAADIQADVDALTGGRRYGDVTTEDVNDCIGREAERQRVAQVDRDHSASIAASGLNEEQSNPARTHESLALKHEQTAMELRSRA